jgi:hypothetical protein
MNLNSLNQNEEKKIYFDKIINFDEKKQSLNNLLNKSFTNMNFNNI